MFISRDQSWGLRDLLQQSLRMVTYPSRMWADDQAGRTSARMVFM